MAVHGAEVEAEDHLGDAVARGLVAPRDLLVRRAADEVHDDDVRAAQVGHDARDHDERVPAVGARDGARVLGLELVVELLVDAVAHLDGELLDVEVRGDLLGDPQQRDEVLQVGAHGGVDARVLDLDGDLAPVVERRAVDLPDRRGRDRLLVERREDAVELLAVVALEDLAHVGERHRRGRVAQLGERRPHLLAVGGRHRVEVDDRQHLARPSSRRPSSTPGRGRSAAPRRPGGGRARPPPRPGCGRDSPPRSPRTSPPRSRRAARAPRCAAAGRRGGPPRGTPADRTRPAPRRGGSRPLRSARLDLRAGDDVVPAVGPADPGLVPAVVVVAEQDERRRLAHRGARARRPPGRARARCG